MVGEKRRLLRKRKRTRETVNVREDDRERVKTVWI